jgi:hypothetical protein
MVSQQHYGAAVQVEYDCITNCWAVLKLVAVDEHCKATRVAGGQQLLGHVMRAELLNVLQRAGLT